MQTFTHSIAHEWNNVQANKRKDTRSFPKTNYINFAYLKREKCKKTKTK